MSPETTVCHVWKIEELPSLKYALHLLFKYGRRPPLVFPITPFPVLTRCRVDKDTPNFFAAFRKEHALLDISSMMPLATHHDRS